MNSNMHLVCHVCIPREDIPLISHTGIAAHEADQEVHFHTTYSHDMAASSFSSLQEERVRPEEDLFDFSKYMDQVCGVVV